LPKVHPPCGITFGQTINNNEGVFMKSFLVLVTVLFGSLASAQNMPCAAGEYNGKGQLKSISDGAQVAYDVKYIIDETAKTISAAYVYSNGFAYTLDLGYQIDAQGMITLTDNGAAAGMGSCFSSSCRLNLDYINATLGALKVNVVLTCIGNQIIANGENMTSNTTYEDVVSK
jgi:hypothetical protein